MEVPPLTDNLSLTEFRKLQLVHSMLEKPSAYAAFNAKLVRGPRLQIAESR